MEKRPHFKPVNASSDAIPQSIDRHRGKRFQPRLSLNDRLKRYPMVFWGIIWMSIALPSGFAIGSLINPNAEGPQPVTAIAQNSQNSDTSDIKAAQPAPPVITDSGQLPLWVFGAIAVGCTASCFILAQYIKPIEVEASEVEVGVEVSAEELISPPVLKPRSQRQIHSSPQPLKRLKPYEPTDALHCFAQAERSQPLQPLAVEWVAVPQQFLDPAYLMTDDIAEPVLVTMIPVAETQPLDWGEARLADVMDLRRRHPLHFRANNPSQS
jgi:hypothetical protein